MNNEQQTKNPSQKRLSDFLFILWAGGAALLSYSLVYALRKPYTAAAFEDVEFFDMDYKVAQKIQLFLCDSVAIRTQDPRLRRATSTITFYN